MNKTDFTYHGTTILSVRKAGSVALGGDGQITFGDTVLKAGAKKVRPLQDGKVLAGFAGSIKDHPANLPRAAVELAKQWRTDRYLRRLEAQLAVADSSHSFIISGNGDVIEPDDGVVAIGSGGSMALAAARALLACAELDAKEIVEKALEITADICIYTNRQITVLEL